VEITVKMFYGKGLEGQRKKKVLEQAVETQDNFGNI